MSKTVEAEITKAEACRQAWEELGKDATGIEVGERVMELYGWEAKSSEISNAKQKVWGPDGRGWDKLRQAGANNGSVEVTAPDLSGVEASVDVTVLVQTRDYLRSVGGKDAAMKAISTLEDLQL